MTEMAQIAAASVPPKINLVRNGSCAWLSGLEQWKEGKCFWGSRIGRPFPRRLCKILELNWLGDFASGRFGSARGGAPRNHLKVGL